MRFKLILLDEMSGQAEWLASFDQEASAARTRGFAQTLDAAPPASRRAGAKGNPVMVRSILEDAETAIKAGDLFPTARDASFALGYGYNAVVQALGAAKAKGETTAVLRGVELSYADDVGRI